MTTIKLSYWVVLTAWEYFAAPALGASVPIAALTTAGAIGWSVVAARRVDARAGGLGRSVATVATAFVAASVVAAPASLPLLLVERQHSVAGCPPQATCHPDALILWAAVFVIGFLLVPATFALALPRRQAA